MLTVFLSISGFTFEDVYSKRQLGKTVRDFQILACIELLCDLLARAVRQ